MNNIQKIREEIRALLLAEADKMRAIGATDADVQEDAFIEMVSRNVAKQMLGKLNAKAKKKSSNIVSKRLRRMNCAFPRKAPVNGVK